MFYSVVCIEVPQSHKYDCSSHSLEAMMVCRDHLHLNYFSPMLTCVIDFSLHPFRGSLWNMIRRKELGFWRKSCLWVYSIFVNNVILKYNCGHPVIPCPSDTGPFGGIEDGYDFFFPNKIVVAIPCKQNVLLKYTLPIWLYCILHLFGCLFPEGRAVWIQIHSGWQVGVQWAWEYNQTECWRSCEQLRPGEILSTICGCVESDTIAELVPLLQVSRDGTSDEEKELRERLTGPDPDLTGEERLMVREYLEQYVDAEH